MINRDSCMHNNIWDYNMGLQGITTAHIKNKPYGSFG